MPSRPPRAVFPVGVALLALVSLLASSSCRRGATSPLEGLRVRPLDEARADLLLSATIGPLDRLVSRTDELARRTNLPFRGEDLRLALTARAGLTPEVLAGLDGGKPIGVAIVGRGRNADPVTVVAAQARSDEAAARLVAALGPVVGKQEKAEKLQRPDGTTVWALRNGSRLYVSDTVEALVAGGALAHEARKELPDDFVLTAYPPAFARWQATDLRSGLGALKRQALDEQDQLARQQGRPGMPRAERASLEATLDAAVEVLSDARQADLAVAIQPDAGGRLSLHVRPRPGTPLAARLARPGPYKLDPTLGAGGGAPAFVWATGASPTWLELNRNVLAAQARAGVRGADEVARLAERLSAQLTGAWSGALRPAGNGLAFEAVAELKPGAGQAALDAVHALTTAPALTDLLREAYGRQAPTVRAARAASEATVELAFPVGEGRQDVGRFVKALFGAATLTTTATVDGDRLRLRSTPSAASMSGRSTAPTGELGAALAATSNHDGFVYLDLWAVVRPALSMALSGAEAQMLGLVFALPGLSRLTLPVYASYRGGAALSADLRIPLAALSNVGGVLKLLGGGLGGLGGPSGARP